jgi:hypothetical protein
LKHSSGQNLPDRWPPTGPTTTANQIRISFRPCAGFTDLFDYRDDQFGIQAEHAGATQWSGSWDSASRTIRPSGGALFGRSGDLGHGTKQTSVIFDV